jgi:hypothetical protein
MSYLKDWLYFTSGNECPEPYRLWSGLSLLASVLGRKVWTHHGRFQIFPSLYIILVGDAGSGKSTAKNEAKKIFTGTFPEYLASASFQSHQDIIDQMCSAQPKTWNETDSTGQVIKINAYTSFYIVCNEFSSLLSTDKKGMVEFLVDIYDENEFSTGFKTQRLANPERKQKLDNPYVNLLACAVPKYFMGNLKLDLFDGGLGRRLIIVYSERTESVPNPMMPLGGEEAKQRVIEHLKKVHEFQGELHRSIDAMNWWIRWYPTVKGKFVEDPILQQFYQTKPVQVLKVAMLLCMCEHPFTQVITDYHLSAAEELISGLEPAVTKLTAGIGRNELAGVGAQLMDYLARMGGAASMMQIRKFFNRYVNMPEFREIMNHYVDTKELFAVSPDGDLNMGMLMLPPNYKIYQQKQAIEVARLREKYSSQPSSPTSSSSTQPLLSPEPHSSASQVASGSPEFPSSSTSQSPLSTPSQPPTS